MLRVLLLSLLAPALLAAAEPPAPFVPDDHLRLAALAEPAFAPDGARIAYSVTTAEAGLDKATSDLWAVPWAGGPAARVTATPAASEWQPLWSADGRWLYFLSDASATPDDRRDPGEEREQEEENTQLWRMPAGGGKPQRLTSLPGGISDYSLAPDGARAVVVAEVGRAVGHAKGTPPPIEIDRFHFKEDGRGRLDDRTRQLFVVDLAGGRAHAITSGARDHWGPAWSPDGRWIAYTAKDQGEADRTLDSNIFVVAPGGGAPRRISPSPNADNDPDWEARVAWSPDSRRLLWLEGDADKWIYYGTPQLAVADLAGGAVVRPARIDRWFYKPRFAPDGSIVALVEQDRDTWLARIDPASGALTYLTQGPRFGVDFAVAGNGRIALLEGDSRTPYALHALDGAATRTLDDHNRWIAARAFGEDRDIAFRSSGAVEIHGYLTLPPGYDGARRLPLVAVLHGGPVYQHSHEFDLDKRALAAAGYAVLSINPRGSSGRGFDFARAIYAEWGKRDVDDIRAGIDHAIALGIADPDRIAVGGWSYGGILTDYMIASDSRIRAAVSGAGAGNFIGLFGLDMYAREYLLELGAPWERFDTWKALSYPFLEAGRIKAPTLFLCAEADDNVPCAGAEQMYLALKTRGVPTHLTVYPGENHGLEVPSYLIHRIRTSIAWYDRWLGPAAR